MSKRSRIQMFDKVLDLLKAQIVFQPKGLFVPFSHVSMQTAQVLPQGLHLVVIRALVVRNDGDSIGHLEGVGIGSVVHKHDLREVSPDQSQVLHIVSLLNVLAVTAIEPMLHVLASRIQVVNHLICVGLVARSEDHYLEVLSQIGQKLPCAWTNVKRRDHRPASSEVNGQLNLMRLAQLLKAVDQCLIEIKDYRKLTCVKRELPLYFSF